MTLSLHSSEAKQSMTKTCSRCKENKLLEDFNKHPHGKNGRLSRCRSCISELGKEKRGAPASAEREAHNRKKLDQYHANKESYHESHRKWLAKPENHERALAKAREYKKSNRALIRIQINERRMHDPLKRIADNCRTRLREIFLGRGGSRHGRLIKKMDKTIKLIGCSYNELRKHLESGFADGMTWDNYGRGTGKWVIDHIIPICSFDLRIRENQYIAFNYTNLRPFWWRDNMDKVKEDKKKCIQYA